MMQNFFARCKGKDDGLAVNMSPSTTSETTRPWHTRSPRRTPPAASSRFTILLHPFPCYPCSGAGHGAPPKQVCGTRSWSHTTLLAVVPSSFLPIPVQPLPVPWKHFQWDGSGLRPGCEEPFAGYLQFIISHVITSPVLTLLGSFTNTNRAAATVVMPLG